MNYTCLNCGKIVRGRPSDKRKFCSQKCQALYPAIKIGTRFGRLVVIERLDVRSHGSFVFQCQCDCGKTMTISTSELKRGNTQSCGCYQKEGVIQRNRDAATHGHTRGDRVTPTFSSWAAMISRCANANNVGFKNYGGRGITVCERWLHSFENFLDDMGERPTGKTIDRIDNDGN